MSADDVVEIVAAGPDDAALVHVLVRELAAHEGSSSDVTTTVERWRELLAHDDVHVLLALVDGDPVGFVSAVRKLHLWTGRDIVALDDLWVRPDWRNRQIGESLMRALADRHPGLAVRWEVDEGNLAGQRFYLRLGARLRRKVVAWWQPTADADAGQPSPSR
ncbi:MAG: GNAT family N-acetyltransferase [Acidimicrobiales bacterium]